MSRLSIDIGYYPESCNEDTGLISLTGLADLAQTVEQVEGSEWVHGDWIYAPLQPIQGRTGNSRPYSARIFGLPKTHRLTHKSASGQDQLLFLTWCLGFFLGLRLTTTEAGFVDATPIRAGQLNDFDLVETQISDVLDLSDAFWNKHQANVRNVHLVEGIIHTFFYAQNPRHLDFERFTFLYICLDACFALTKSTRKLSKSRTTHAERIVIMCEEFGIHPPRWAATGSNGDSDVSALRNSSIHEALFAGEPLGFAVYENESSSGDMLLEMEALICRLLTALLGSPNADYIVSPVHTRQRHGL